ncbi:hypothetical protein Noda2021_07700 [Candidatus Dependentiae bacterium Noda2021]|nr:hypothetical protein Noda2021_07700 [Candidatus Dependentiae bacterium Noda2021]
MIFNKEFMNKTVKIACEIFVFNGQGLLLLGKRKNCYGDGTWALPGGHLEYGETLLECARRELKEELGIEHSSLQLIAITDDINDARHYVHASFLIKEYDGPVLLMEPDKCYEWHYFHLSELPINFFEPHIKILQTFFNKCVYLPK